MSLLAVKNKRYWERLLSALRGLVEPISMLNTIALLVAGANRRLSGRSRVRIIVIVYHILRTKQPYHDLGEHSFEQLEAPRLDRKLEQLGYTVTLAPQVA